MMIPAESAVRIVHASVPGRARYAVAGLEGDAALGERLTQSLRSAPGVREVKANALTGTVLLLFNPTASRETYEAVLLAAVCNGSASQLRVRQGSARSPARASAKA